MLRRGGLRSEVWYQPSCEGDVIGTRDVLELEEDGRRQLRRIIGWSVYEYANVVM